MEIFIGPRYFRGVVCPPGSLRLNPENCLRLDGSPDWPDGFPVGFRMVGEDGECRGSGWNKYGSMLQFEGQLPRSLQIGGAIELLSGEEAPVLGQRLILARAGLSPKEIATTMRLATTRCTNALLEGKGIEPVLFVTQGFPNLLEIGDQRRTGLFDLVPLKNARSCTARWWRLKNDWIAMERFYKLLIFFSRIRCPRVVGRRS